jgi:hypothetical protein
MDIRTGKTYETKEAALEDGVPESDIAEVRRAAANTVPIVRFASGPFKNRLYVRNPATGNLVRLRMRPPTR